MLLERGAQKPDLDREFKDAVAKYEAGKYPEAAAQLEKILREVPDSFEVQELLGSVYAAQSRNDKANDHLEKAVRRSPIPPPHGPIMRTICSGSGRRSWRNSSSRKPPRSALVMTMPITTLASSD